MGVEKNRVLRRIYQYSLSFINFVTKNNKGEGRGLNNFVPLKSGGNAYLRGGLDGL